MSTMILTDKLNHLISNITRKYSQSSTEGKRNPWVIGWFGLVAVFLSVNAVFVVLAVVSSPGLVVEDYYESNGYMFRDVRIFAHNFFRKAVMGSLQSRLRFEDSDLLGRRSPTMPDSVSFAVFSASYDTCPVA